MLLYKKKCAVCFGYFISPNFRSTTKLICLMRQLYKNTLSRFSSKAYCFLAYDMGRLNNKDKVLYGEGGGGAKNVILPLVYILNGFYTKSLDKK